jgi:hypothetical protein
MGGLTAELAARLPDLPRLVETRAILLSGACEVLGDAAGGHYVVRSLENALAAIVGRPSPGAVREAAERGGPADVLCAEDALALAAAALPGWSASPAAVHVLAAAPPPAAVPPGFEVRLIAPDETLVLAHLPGALRREMEGARQRSPLAAAFDGSRAVSFAYAPWQTETLFDLSVDTLVGHRQRGLGAAAVLVLVEHMRARGRQPVWGALEDNVPSLRLAARLGFVPVDRLFVLSQGKEAQ